MENSVIIITGASAGIGAHLAKQLVQLGAKVIIASRNAAALQMVADTCVGNGQVLIHTCDVTKRSDHESLLAATLTRFGKLTTWINNAGVGMNRKVQDLSEEDMDEMFNINTKSVIIGMQTAVKYFKSSEGGNGIGQVINISSQLGRLPYVANRSMYGAAKAAMNMLTANMRIDLQQEGYDKIAIALFSPGPVATEFANNSRYSDNNVSTRAPTIPPLVQTTEEIATMLIEMILHPEKSVDVYSRPLYQENIARYYSAEDVRDVEQGPPFIIASSAVAKAKVGGEEK